MLGRSKSHGPLRLLRLVGFSRLALLAWAWRNRRDLGGWMGWLGRLPSALGDPAKRQTLFAEAKVRAGITSDATARAAGLDVEMIGPVAHVTATRGNEEQRKVALETFGQRRPDVVLVKDATPAS